MKTTTKTVTAQIAPISTIVCQKSSEPAMLMKLDGRTAMMPAMMIREAPLPTPYSVINSPIHITMTAPVMSPKMTTGPSSHVSRIPASTISGRCMKIPV